MKKSILWFYLKHRIKKTEQHYLVVQRYLYENYKQTVINTKLSKGYVEINMFAPHPDPPQDSFLFHPISNYVAYAQSIALVLHYVFCLKYFVFNFQYDMHGKRYVFERLYFIETHYGINELLFDDLRRSNKTYSKYL